MRVLVTGGAGFIGSHVATALVSSGHAVVVLDDLSGGDARNVPPAATFVRGDICDERCVDRLFAENRFEVVYHLAAHAAEGLSHFIRRGNYTNNLIGSANLINAAVNFGAGRFVFTSSIAVYGANQPPMTEDLVPRPEDPYGIAKLAVEQDLAAAQRVFDLEYVILRPHNVYGERQNLADPYRNVVGIFMQCLLAGRPLPIFGDGSQTRAFSYIADVAPIIAHAGFAPGARNEIFNVGADRPVSVIELARVVSRAFGRPPDLDFQPARPEVCHAFSTHEKAGRAFGALPATPLEEGVERMAAWARQAGPWRPKPPEGIEIERNLPPRWAAISSRGAVEGS